MGARTVEILSRVQVLSKEYGLLIAGSLPEKHGERVYNTLYITGPEGVVGTYRKQYLFSPMEEDDFFSPGDNPSPVETPLGPVSALVCFDLRFPGLASDQAAKGSGLMIVSAQWPEARKDHWRTLVLARAIENQMYVVACNRCGETGGTRFAGHSIIVAPDGKVLAEANEDLGASGAMLDPADVSAVRARFSTAGLTPYKYSDRNKTVSLEELKRKVSRYKKTGRRVIFTNGCFDIMHSGHVTYLEAARREGDCLIIGLNSDRSVRSIKGPERPVNNEESRARVLSALGCVDHVVLFSEETPLDLIKAVMPDVLVKGADWPVEKIVGAAEVMASGGRVANVPLVEDFSTTAVIDKIRNSKNQF